MLNRRALLQSGLLLGAAGRAADAAPQAKPAAPPKPAPRPLIVDAHCHAGRGLNYGQPAETTDPWTTFNDPERTLRRMKEAGIDRTVIFPINNTTYDRANEEIAGYVRRWPDRFIGFAKHDCKTESGRLRELLRRDVRELGLRGVKLHGVPTEELVAAAAEFGLPVLYHPPRVEESLAVIRAYPEVPFILAHLGSFASRDWREHVRAIEAARALPNLHLETSSVVFVDYLEQAARALPAEKLIFGSDGPLVDARIELQKIRLLKLPKTHEPLVLGGNLLRLLET